MKFVSCMGDSWPLIYNCWCLALILVIMSCFNPLDFLTFFCVSSNGSQDTFEENHEKKAIIPVGRKRLTRSRFSYSFSPHGIIPSYYLFISLDATLSIVIYLNASASDMKSFTVEEEQKERKDGTEECSPGGVLEDCSVSTESKTSSCISNRYESETISQGQHFSLRRATECHPNATTAPALGVISFVYLERDLHRAFIPSLP